MDNIIDTRKSIRITRLVLLAAMFGGLIAWSATASPAAATTINVTTTNDEISDNNLCSLREAIIAANLDRAGYGCAAGDGADTIVVPAGNYEFLLTGTDEDETLSGDLDITDDLTIVGAATGDSAIIPVYTDRVFHIMDAGVEFRRLVITEGRAPDGKGSGILVENGRLRLKNSVVQHHYALPLATGEGRGGGIYLSGLNSQLIVEGSHLFLNTVDGEGGGIWGGASTSIAIIDSWLQDNSGGTGGALYHLGAATIINSTLSGNLASTDLTGGGAIYSAGKLLLENVTLSNNRALGNGGGLMVDTSGTADLYNVTLTNNTADDDADGTGSGGGLYVDAVAPFQSVTIQNTIISGNQDESPTGNIHPDCSGDPFNSGGYNLIFKTIGCAISGRPDLNLYGVAAKLGPLQDNGGPTLTHGLQANSPAIDAGDPDGCANIKGVALTTDQRGYARPVKGDKFAIKAICDIGAFEFLSPGAPTATPTRTPTATPSITATPTDGPSPTPSATPTDGPSPTPSATPTDGPSPTPSATATDGPSPTPFPATDWVYLPVSLDQ